MSHDDRLASPTLALLYIAQGHVKRAKAIVEAILEQDPRHGPALAMRERLAPRPVVSARVDPATGEIEVTWQATRRPGFPSLLHVIMATWSDDDCAAAVRVSSVRCDASRGSTRVSPGLPAGAMSVCLGGLDDARRFVPIAVAEPVVW